MKFKPGWRRAVLLILASVSVGQTWVHLSGFNDSLSSATTSCDASTHKEASHAPDRPLPPVHVNSSWIGNQWIPPPGYRTYSTLEIQRYFQNQTILFIGDSTARRTYATFFGILNATAPNDVSVDEVDHARVIDVGKRDPSSRGCPHRQGYKICRTPPRTATTTSNYSMGDVPGVDLMGVTCLHELAEMVGDPSSVFRTDLTKYDLVVFIIGPWEVLEKWECTGLHGRRNSTDNLFQSLFSLTNTAETPSIVWRTWGSPGTSNSDPATGEKQWKAALSHNRFVKDLVDLNEVQRRASGKPMSAVSYIDWGRAMRPRLLPQERRIVGDMDPHYGLESRLAFVQMLMNHLVERDRQKRFNLKSWILENTDSVNSIEDDDREAGGFLSTSPPAVILTKEEMRAFEEAKSFFCSECTWTGGVNCALRMKYVQNRYKLAESEALFAVMKMPACNSSSPAR